MDGTLLNRPAPADTIIILPARNDLPNVVDSPSRKEIVVAINKLNAGKSCLTRPYPSRVRLLVRRCVGPKGRWSEKAILWSEGALVRRFVGQKVR